MSIRCNIAFYAAEDAPLDTWEALLYKHDSGYPESMLPIIVPVLKFLRNDKGLDKPDALAAWLLYAFCHITRNYEEIVGRSPHYTGYGITTDFVTNISYLYLVYPDSIKVMSVDSITHDGIPRGVLTGKIVL